MFCKFHYSKNLQNPTFFGKWRHNQLTKDNANGTNNGFSHISAAGIMHSGRPWHLYTSLFNLFAYFYFYFQTPVFQHGALLVYITALFSLTLSWTISRANSLRPGTKWPPFPDDISNVLSWMKMYKFRLRFHWSLLPRVELTILQHCSDNGLAPARRQAVIWTNGG